jgi:hypothetical protein
MPERDDFVRPACAGAAADVRRPHRGSTRRFGGQPQLRVLRDQPIGVSGGVNQRLCDMFSRNSQGRLMRVAGRGDHKASSSDCRRGGCRAVRGCVGPKYRR